jgi:hypothetical protein
MSERWRDNWLVVSPAGALCVDLHRSASGRRSLGRTLRDLRPGTVVVLRASGLLARRRCRGLATTAGLELEREYLAFPSAAAPAFLVEDASAPVGVFVRSFLVAPPRTAASLPLEGALAVVRGLRLWPLVRALAPGRVVVGRRA